MRYKTEHHISDNFERYEKTNFNLTEQTLLSTSSEKFRMCLHAKIFNFNEVFTFEALKQTALTGTNQTFICHDDGIQPLQAMSFVQYFAEQVTVKITTEISNNGAIITLSNGAKLFFYHADSKTHAGTSGDVYIGGFHYLSEREQKAVLRIASGIVSLKGRRITCFSSSQDPQKTVDSWKEKDLLGKAFVPVCKNLQPNLHLGCADFANPKLFFYLAD